MSKPLAIINHWSGAKVTVTAAAPELGLATMHICHDDITFALSLSLDESELRALRDGVEKALALVIKNNQAG